MSQILLSFGKAQPDLYASPFGRQVPVVFTSDVHLGGEGGSERPSQPSSPRRSVLRWHFELLECMSIKPEMNPWSGIG